MSVPTDLFNLNLDLFKLSLLTLNIIDLGRQLSTIYRDMYPQQRPFHPKRGAEL